MSKDADKDDAIHGLAFAMMNMKELAAPVEEAARGYRAELLTYGWTDESAERMACEWYILVMRNMQASAGKGVNTDEDSTGDVDKPGS